MKRTLYILITLVLINFSLMSFGEKRGEKKVQVDEQFEKYYDTLTKIYKKNRIKFNYKNVSKITHMDSLPDIYKMDGVTFDGLYHKITKVIYINTSQMHAFFLGKYDQKILLILAHEMAHSQGKDHSSDKCSVMYPNSGNVMRLLENQTVEELVTEIYKIDYPLLEEEVDFGDK